MFAKSPLNNETVRHVQDIELGRRWHQRRVHGFGAGKHRSRHEIEDCRSLRSHRRDFDGRHTGHRFGNGAERGGTARFLSRAGTEDISCDELNRTDSRIVASGRHKGHHHFIDLSLVADVEGQKVRLSANAAVAVTFEEEK
jgi:hypothetical protein